ncbi:hypothetical protein [Phaeospirillum tilakii]|uniref:Uncharacterized protein n=1 Tax=Phaeospirillum tilakii TaxID=741673 RepID=A0ABW5CDY2_9PROT
MGAATTGSGAATGSGSGAGAATGAASTGTGAASVGAAWTGAAAGAAVVGAAAAGFPPLLWVFVGLRAMFPPMHERLESGRDATRPAAAHS